MYTTDRIWSEVVYIAYYLHWPLDPILDMEHDTRRRVIGEVGAIHRRLDAEA